MLDPRLTRLAEVLISHSIRLKKGEKVLIEAFDIPDPLVIELIRKVVKVGAIPFVSIKHNSVLREIYRNATPEGIGLIGDYEKWRMQRVDAYIAVRGSDNSSELGDVPGDKMKLYQRYWWKKVHGYRVAKTKWVVLRYPTPSMAQQAQMSTETFEDFFFDVCTLDYNKMAKAIKPLKKLMERTDKVHIKGPETDLSFSIKAVPVIPCIGERNIPDGECFTAPVKSSVEGTIAFNVPTIYLGTTFDRIHLEFKKGKIIKASADKITRLNEILDTDRGARYIGEFSFGFNPYITRPMQDILFDEKIAGSFHFTPGSAYEEADNGNRSEVHWDMVMIQTPQYGGGEVYLDGKLIRKNGKFVTKNLEGLNPKNLK